MELITVIVPVYNAQYYLKRCLLSIVSQSYKYLEIILIEDGSSDDSRKICNRFEMLDQRITVLHKEWEGLPKSRNIGIEISRGEYIVLINPDDFIHVDYIKTLYELIKGYDVDIAICNVEVGISGVFHNKGKINTKIYTAEEMLKQWDTEYREMEVQTYNKLYKKKLFRDAGIQYPMGFFHEEMLTHQLIAHADLVAITNEKLYYYNDREDCIAHIISQDRIHDYLTALELQTKDFSVYGYQNAYERLLIRKQKSYMSYYCIADKHKFEKLKSRIWSEYKNSYQEVISCKKIRRWDKFRFFLFLKGRIAISIFYKILSL